MSRALHLYAIALSTLPTWGLAGTLVGNALVNPTDRSGQRLPTDQLVLVILDTAGDGFAASSDQGITAGPLGNSLGTADDLIIGSNATATGLFPGDIVGPGDAVFSDGLYAGKPFGLVFFDQLPANSGAITSSTDYGLATAADWVLPASGSPTFGGSGFTVVANGTTNLSVGTGNVMSMSYHDWATAQFGDASAPNALMTANSDGDAYNNLFEYAFDMDPFVSSQSGAPTITPQSDTGGEYLLIDYALPTDRTGIQVMVEVSPDMQQWFGGSGEVQEILNETVGGRHHRQARSMTSNATRLFMRARVTLSGEAN